MHHTKRITHTYTRSSSKQVMLSIINSPSMPGCAAHAAACGYWGGQEKISWFPAVKLIWIRPWDCPHILALCGYGSHVSGEHHIHQISWYNHSKSLKMNYALLAESQTSKTLSTIHQENPFGRVYRQLNGSFTWFRCKIINKTTSDKLRISK